MNFANPEENISALDIRAGMMVADFGAGSGAYSLALSRAVGPDGRIYAVDIQKDLLDRLKSEAERQGFDNIEVLWGDLERAGGSKLKDGLVDVVLLSNIFFQTDSKYQLALEAKRVLKPDGEIVVMDWSDSYSNLGPHPESVFGPEKAKEVFNEAGLTFVRDFPAGPHHYGLIFKKTN